MGKSRAPEHLAFFQWLLTQIEKHKVDALIVAGDIFDTGSPPSYAREMYNQFIVDLQQTGCELVILGGNHDSVATLNESKELLACLNTYVISGVIADTDNHSQVISLKNRAGKVSAILCAVPFIRPRDVIISKAGQSGKEKQQAMQQAISDHYHVLYQAAEVERDKYQTGKKNSKNKLPIIATGHLTTVGASTSDSVREIYIGTLDAFPANAFPPADYIALGHIHKSQKVAKSDHIRYSGSPIPLSFDESGADEKSVLMVDFEAGKFKKAKPLNIPNFQPMHIIKGNLKGVEKELKTLSKTYKLQKGQSVWVEILVSSQDYLNDLQNRVQQLSEDLPVEILLLRRERKNKKNTLEKEAQETLNELSVDDVFERRLSEEDWHDDEEQARLDRIKRNFRQVVDELESGADPL